YIAFSHKPLNYANDLSCPVLLQWGTKDQYVSKEEIERIFENISSINKQLVLYPNAEHEAYLQVQPELWKKEVARFINSF
ncbi:MAG TPA: alpha/beta hydrolase, partial [Chitinophagaceae bacterium]|nr:alpha/beta hydrolase [Chitinophagaceae bacterium]